MPIPPPFVRAPFEGYAVIFEKRTTHMEFVQSLQSAFATFLNYVPQIVGALS